MDHELTLHLLSSSWHLGERLELIISIDFSKKFLDFLGTDLHVVLLEFFRSVSLPVSCQRAVLPLLPKNVKLCATGELEAS